ncbi:MAG: GTP 3',8-cyclase MoaA [Archaeoglobaceae archaeon]|nr:GTP 3',8-cyclase MoaA [Archaeoglobaceae archaeon]MDW8128664.1 GTP 3',8-cyclase MoaA [Archaeoglobaceae archaeon]
MLTDPFGRTVKNLRISVTNRCNLNCIYCHREGESNPGKEMSAERIAEIAKAFYDLGVKKLKLTGGEPLLREDICEIISMMPNFEEISLTTNGTLLKDLAFDLKESGLDRVNISLDTLNADIYSYLTGGGKLQNVLEGIRCAVEANLTPIKLNMVLMKNLNEFEVFKMLNFTNSFNKEKTNVILQLIELIPNTKTKDLYLDPEIFEEEFAKIAMAVKIRDMHKRKQFFTSLGIVEIVKPLDNTEFCMHCNRIRVTSDGKIKLCLMNKETVDISNLSGNELKKAIFEAIRLRKPFFR